MAPPNGMLRIAHWFSATLTTWEVPAVPSMGGGVSRFTQVKGPVYTVTVMVAGPPAGFPALFEMVAGRAVAVTVVRMETRIVKKYIVFGKNV